VFTRRALAVSRGRADDTHEPGEGDRLIDNAAVATQYRSGRLTIHRAAPTGEDERCNTQMPGQSVRWSVRHHQPMSDVPVQYFQSIIAFQIPVAGALLFQVRFFETKTTDSGPKVDPRIRLVMILVITATLFASLEAMREGWGHLAAAFVTAGLAVSLLPILLRVLPPLTRDVETQERDPRLWITVLGLILYCATVTIIVLIK